MGILNREVREWVPGDGEHRVVIIPYEISSGRNSPFRNKWNRPFSSRELTETDLWDYKLTIFIHRDPPELCMKSFDEECPRCEWSPAFKIAVYNVVVLDSKEDRRKGIQVWQAPHASIEDALTERARDKKTGEIIPYGFPEEGYAVYFEKTGSGLAREYTEVDLVRHNMTEKELNRAYEGAYDLENILL